MPLVAGAALLAGCSDIFSPRACTMEARPGITVVVLDSATNAPVGEGARIIATDGAFADTVVTVADYGGPYGFVHERAGSYTVRVEKEGYQSWSTSDVRVIRGDCHVHTTSVAARLSATGSGN
jgi:hypothetical protein